jgi:hypothetical protein
MTALLHPVAQNDNYLPARMLESGAEEYDGPDRRSTAITLYFAGQH